MDEGSKACCNGWANVVIRTHDGPKSQVSPYVYTRYLVLINVVPYSNTFVVSFEVFSSDKKQASRVYRNVAGEKVEPINSSPDDPDLGHRSAVQETTGKKRRMVIRVIHLRVLYGHET